MYPFFFASGKEKKDALNFCSLGGGGHQVRPRNYLSLRKEKKKGGFLRLRRDTRRRNLST